MKKLFAVIFDFVMRYLGVFTLSFILTYWLDTVDFYSSLVIMFLVTLGNSISTRYNINKALKNKQYEQPGNFIRTK